MKKFKFILLGIVFAMTSHFLQAQSGCTAGELISLSSSYDSPCESSEFWFNNNVSIYLDRAFLKSGTIQWKWRKIGNSSWASLSSEWFIHPDGHINLSIFKFNHNGEYRIIFTESGTGCKDTLITSLSVLKAPKPGVGFQYTCYGGIFTAGDARNPSGNGNTYSWDSGGGVYVPGPKTQTVSCSGCTWLSTGGPQVLITNSNGCSATGFYPNPVLNSQPATYTVTASQNPIGPGQSSILTAVTNYAVSSYKWYKTGSTTLLGTGSQYTVNYSDVGKYKARFKIANADGGCIFNKFITINASGPSSKTSSDEIYDATLVVYPNPASSEITLNGNEEVVEIYDMNGRLIKSINTPEINPKVDVRDLPQGLYLIKSMDQTTKLNIVR
jgi:hypothetical protein